MSIRYEKAERLLAIALEMQASRAGVSLAEMQRSLGVGRRTAERMRDAILRLFPMAEEVVGSEREKRWRLPAAGRLASTEATAEDLSDLEIAIRLLEAKGLKAKPTACDGSRPDCAPRFRRRRPTAWRRTWRR